MTPKHPLLNDLDWPGFMSRHDLHWDRLPDRWENGLFLGNGLVGTLMHVDPQQNRIRWWFCRSDVGQMGEKTKLDNLVNRRVLGSLDIVPVCDLTDTRTEARLDLWNAEGSGQFDIFRGLITWRCFVPAQCEVVVLELDWESDYIPVGFHLDTTHQRPVSRREVDDIELFTFDDYDDERGGGYAIACRRFPLGGQRQIVVFSVGSSPSCRAMWNPADDGRSAEAEALGNVRAFDPQELDELRRDHRSHWHDLYRRSFVSLGDTELESFYWIQLYKLRSACRGNSPLIDNHGPWTTESSYGFSTWDMNVQATYRLHLPTNHHEVGQSLVTFMDQNYTRERMLHEPSGELRAGVTHSAFLKIMDLHYDHEMPPLSTTSADSACKFLWACHNVWLHYRYTMDPELLEPLADRLAAGINAFVAYAELGEDGLLHVHDGYSWEAIHGCEDPVCYIAVVEWAIHCRQEIDRLLGRESDPRWTTILDQLPPYAEGPEGYYLAPGHPPVPHRHWSHLMQIWPFFTVHWDDPEHREMIQKSVDHWVDLSAGPQAERPRAGFAVAAAIHFYALMEQPEKLPPIAEIFMREWTKRGPCTWASTLYRENGPVLESPLLFADALVGCLLQSWNDTIRVFPAWPEAWGDVVFAELRSEGGFTVSAARQNGKLAWVTVHSLAGEPCRLRLDLADYSVHGLATDRITRLDERTLAIALTAGDTVTLCAPGVEPPPSIEPIPADPEACNSFGLNERFIARREGKQQPQRLAMRGRGTFAWPIPDDQTE